MRAGQFPTGPFTSQRGSPSAITRAPQWPSPCSIHPCFRQALNCSVAHTSRAASPRAEGGKEDNQDDEEDRKDHRRAETACLNAAWDGVISLYPRYEIKSGLLRRLLAGRLFTRL